MSVREKEGVREERERGDMHEEGIGCELREKKEGCELSECERKEGNERGERYF